MSFKSKWNKLKNSVSPFKGSLLGGLFAGPVGMYYGSQYDQMLNANKMQNEMIERQNELNMQMWNLQNEYNSPSAQMQRYKDAGLNPNLIYGSVSNGNATSAPEMTATTSLSSRDALASVIHQAIGDSWQVSKKVATSMILKNIDLDLEQKQANVNLTNSKSQRVLKSVDTQAPKTGRYGELYNLGKEIGGDLVNVADTAYRALPVGMNRQEKKTSNWAEMKFLRGEWSKKKYFGFLKRQIDNGGSSHYKYLWKKYERY